MTTQPIRSRFALPRRIATILFAISFVGLTLHADAASEAQPTPEPMTGTAPICPYASHDRLFVRPGRDVCGATLNAEGKPTTRGYLPTRCAVTGNVYRIDAVAMEDRCLVASTDQARERGDP